jgi:hypothetical protein
MVSGWRRPPPRSTDDPLLRIAARGYRRVIASRRYLAAVALALGVAFAAPVGGEASTNGPVAEMAKTCGSGYVHARINGAEKCLRRGEYCAHSANRQYRRYGYSCTKRDANGAYHLT